MLRGIRNTRRHGMPGNTDTDIDDRVPSPKAAPDEGRDVLVAARPSLARRSSSGLAEHALAARLYESLDRVLVYRYRIGANPGFDYVSPSCLTMTGFSQDEFLADPGLVDRLIHPDDAQHLEEVTVASMPDGRVVRWVRKDGSTLWTEHRTALIRGSAGPVAVEGIVRDVSDVSSARQLLATIERSAWRFVMNAPDLAVLIDPLGRVACANEAFLKLTGWTADEVSLARWSSVFLHPDDLRAGRGLLVAVEDGTGQATAPLLLRDGRRHEVSWATMAIPDPRIRRPSVLALGRDLTAEDDQALEVAQLRSAVERSSDIVVVTDAAAQIVSVNPAFERVTGYARRQAVGRNPRILKSGRQAPAFYAGMWSTLTQGKAWHGEVVNRRADGGLVVAEATITPVRDRLGSVVSYVAVERDVTPIRALGERLDAQERQRGQLSEAIGRLSTGESEGATADGIVAMLAELPDVVATAVGVVDGEGSGRIVATRGGGVLGFATGEPLDAAVIRRLARHHADHWVDSPRTGLSRTRTAQLRRAGAGACVFLPVYQHAVPVGVIVVCGSDPDGADILGQMASLTEVAAVMGALLGPEASRRQGRREARARLEQVIADAAYEPVFQPIVDLLNGRRAGFEARTRFADGTTAETVFARARGCGMEHALELATLRSAIRAAEDLPVDAWLGLNISAGLLAAEAEIPELLATVSRELVIEVSDDGSVDDLQAVRLALRGRNVTARLAVDDSGAGAMTPRRLMECQPDFVKVDMALVRNVDVDPRGQEVIHGLRTFARAAGGVLIAEGIETPAERAALTRLGVPFGQGFLYGRPAPAASWNGGR
jgi:PAS domain S-box-containing protein